MNKRTKQTQGFTIIEVVLVLAIAALIMLMVFIAWPALQKSQRDGARKQDAQTVASALGTFKSNNNGKMPGAAGVPNFATFLSQYVPNTAFIDSGKITAGASATTKATNTDSMSVDIGATCAGTAAARGAAVWIKLEGGAGNVDFCVDA